MNQNNKISKFSQLVKDFDIILIDRKDDLMKELSKNNKVIVLKKKAHRPKSDTNNDANKPNWFKSWYKEFKQFEQKQEQFNTQVLEFMKRQEQFNQMFVQRLDALNNRIDNIVKLNNLKE